MAKFNIGRLSEDIKREISVALQTIKDRRVADEIVSISHCELTSDLSYCKVYVSCLGDESKAEAAAQCLKGASGVFKKQINNRIKMRKMPELIFIPDNSQNYYDRISNIIDNLPKAKTDSDGESEEQ